VAAEAALPWAILFVTFGDKKLNRLQNIFGDKEQPFFQRPL
jgi:hypothetical protein